MVDISRRHLLQSFGASAAAVLLSQRPSYAKLIPNKIKAIAFDGFPIFDPRPVFAKAIEIFPVKGEQLVNSWRAKQFSYQWLRASGNTYKNFWDVTKDALEFAAIESGVTLSESEKEMIMNQYRSINIWPDVKSSLSELKSVGLKLSFLTNMTSEMVLQGLKNADISGQFQHIISTDKIRTYKPAPAAYQLGVDILKLKKEEILFVAFAGWDMAGAKWFGYPTYWVNRSGSPAEKLDAIPDGEGKNLTDLVKYVKEHII